MAPLAGNCQRWPTEGRTPARTAQAISVQPVSHSTTFACIPPGKAGYGSFNMLCFRFVGRGHDPADQVGLLPCVRPTGFVWMATHQIPFNEDSKLSILRRRGHNPALRIVNFIPLSCPENIPVFLSEGIDAGRFLSYYNSVNCSGVSRLCGNHPPAPPPARQVRVKTRKETASNENETTFILHHGTAAGYQYAAHRSTGC